MQNSSGNSSSNPPAEVELLAPAGNWDCARAAVANGADAIYFGLPKFNARLRADNFAEKELPELMHFLHGHGVRGFVAFNTLVFTNELHAAEDQLAWLQESRVDAIIVQDLGLASVAKRVAPEVELHASTQMTITSPEGLDFVRKLAVDRAVLARELSLREMDRFRQATVPLEVFVHGALCVAYSGQCLTSESLGLRSANRGECAQACRMPYQLVVDGELRELGDRRFLLSPQDLAAVDEIPQLIRSGVTSFKIEGRLKSPEYVAAVTRVYRKAIDAALAGEGRGATREDRYDLEMTFSRGLFSGWMHGVDHQRLVGARFGKKRGPFVGRVMEVSRDGAVLDELQIPLQPGDGVVFDTGEDTNAEQGGFLYGVSSRRLEFQHGKINWDRIPLGTRVWKTSDPVLEKRLRATFKGTLPLRKHLELRLRVAGTEGAALVLSALSETGHELARVESTMPLLGAAQRPLTADFLRANLEKLGGTPYFVSSLDFALVGSVILPVSELNRMRRALLDQLKPIEISRGPAHRGITAQRLAEIATHRSERADEAAELTVLCRTMNQIRTVASAGICTVYADFEDIRLAAEAVTWIKENCNSKIFLATPRIQKPGEQGFFRFIERAGPHGVLVRNLGAINYFVNRGMPCHGDFSLNVANPLTADFLRTQGLQRLTISYDLNIDQVLELLKAAPPQWFELTIHQHMPMFHMEHCVFAAFMSNGKSFLDCGRPCEHHSVRLRDRVGMEHPLKADVGCRNTLFNAVAQTGAKFYSPLFQAGLRNFRIELLQENEAELRGLLQAYRDLLSGHLAGDSLWRQLKAQSQLGVVTSGTIRA